MSETLQALMLGDVIGQSGCRALFIGLQALLKETKADIVVCNAENAADGFGLTPEIADQLLSAGITVLTSGNHIWQKREILSYINTSEKVIRPANYPAGVEGKGYTIIEVKGVSVGVVNLQGRLRLSPIIDPFKFGKECVRQLKQTTKIIIIDFHAEDTEEKEALGLYLDGSISALVGTHTHIQTADEKILPGGTAYITDLGSISPVDSVIGFDVETAINRSLTQMPLKMEVSDNPSVIQGALIHIDKNSGKAISIERISKESSL